MVLVNLQLKIKPDVKDEFISWAIPFCQIHALMIVVQR